MVRNCVRFRVRVDSRVSVSVRMRIRVPHRVRCRVGGRFPFQSRVMFRDWQSLGHR